MPHLSPQSTGPLDVVMAIFATLPQAYRAMRDYDELSRMSATRLARQGLTRDAIAGHIIARNFHA